ncbi:polysaccharide biosynthesis protein [Bacillus sp. 31A1R]|uniref:Polysaccharide biosynthesis protein n=1 Tax=Robertmurraya mangrovi TaxID=3098077 RepID=A0ABU5J4I4_9BACI|nr:polysaccharide biosynthesis protein [Bacillus sp. 31A1R]MDZ5474324.1 polysaccharide biosynthesis protein [Bacillus sp. 31A1R]
MKPGNQHKDIFKGALILTIAALITKILSAIYRVPFQNIVGDVGFYIYQQVYPFYGIALVLSTYGFPVVISKLYAERESAGDTNGKQQVIIVGTLFLLVVGILSFFTLYIGAEWLANQMNDKGLAILLKVISICFLIFPLLSVLRGYFQGKGDMAPTAFSQIGEQFVRVGTILIAATFMMYKGKDLYSIGAGAVFGSVMGGLCAFIILILIFSRRKKSRLNVHRLIKSLKITKSAKIVKVLLVQGFAICISSMLLIFMQLADSLNLYSLLILTGINGEDAKELKGVYDRGQPLIQIGMVVATSMSLALVPLIASEKVKKQTGPLIEKVRIAILISVVIGVGATVGLAAIIEPTNIMLFQDKSGSEVLALLSVLILLSSVIITITAILQGLGHSLFPAIMILIGFLLKFWLNIQLVPSFGTTGAALASILALVMILLVLSMKLKQKVREKFILLKNIWIILLAVTSMILFLQGYKHVTNVFYYFGHERMVASLQAISAVLMGGFIYLFIIIRGNLFSQEELSMLPFGSKLIVLKGRRK